MLVILKSTVGLGLGDSIWKSSFERNFAMMSLFPIWKLVKMLLRCLCPVLETCQLSNSLPIAMAQRRARGVRASALSALIAAGFVGASVSFVAGLSGPRLQRLAARATVTDVEVEPAAGLGSPLLQDAKERLMDLLEDSSLEEEVLRPEGKPMRGRVDEAIVRLERLNTNEESVAL